MTDSWIDSRRDIFLRDIIRGFIETRRYFDDVKKVYTQTLDIPYAMLDAWVGSENRKGPLWLLKDQCHRLFRQRPSDAHPYEHLFDWAIGSIFHESMKLKEDAYQVSSYKPLLDQQLTLHKGNKELSDLFNQYLPLIERARAGIGGEINNIDDLFARAVVHLKSMLPAYATNMPLLRYLLDERAAVEAVFGAGSLDDVLRRMFSDTVAKAYVVAAEHCIRSGWYKAAQHYLKQILRSDPQHMRSRELMAEADLKINAFNEKD